ncbi:CRISPR-associated endoribonuclease Cas6 [Desulfotomaculum sp. 1211_IL3151]|uniref:CRISPR-associated endoribonuclease Cas6 n=1 Tax=Desulfotomaculum sp. 1211_IL3151 TaxID=3084055 RepID=UPI002FDAAEFC
MKPFTRRMLASVTIYFYAPSKRKFSTLIGFIIKGWLGDFVICGDWQMLKIAFEAGLGGKNSQGFGMFKTI